MVLKNKIQEDLKKRGITSLGNYKPTQQDVDEFKQTGSFSQGVYDKMQGADLSRGQIQKASSLYKDLGKDKFESAINKKYGEGAFDKVKTGIQESTKTLNVPKIPKLDKGLQTGADTTLGEMPEVTETPEIEDPQIDTPEITEPTETETPEITTKEDKVTETPTFGQSKITGIEQLSQMADEMGIPLNETTKNELIKNIAEGNEAVEDYLKSYAVGVGEYTKNKDYYTNFEDINKTRNNVLNDVTAQLKANNGPLTDDQYETIANKYGLTVDQVKNPNSLYKGLKLTPEGEKELGVKKAEQSIEDLTTDYERTKEDIKTNLDQNLSDINQNVTQVEDTLKKNLEVLKAQAVWGGGVISSGFETGLNNVKDEANQTTQKLKQTADRLKSGTDTDLTRLTQDYTKAYTRATDDLKTQLEKLNQSMGIDLTGLSDTYGMGTEEMGKKLDDIAEKYNLNSQSLINSYLTNIRAVNANISESLDIKNKILEQEELIANKRYNEYIANDGILLANTSLSGLMQEYKNGTLSAQKLLDLENIMKTSIVNTLSQISPVNGDNLNTITNLLESGKTPTEIIAEMQKLEKFEAPEEIATVDKTLDLGDRTRVYYSDGTYEDIEKGTENRYGFQNVGEGTIAVTDPTTGKVTFESIARTGDGFTITQNYGDTSPNAKDNVTLANGQVGTPGVDLSMPINTPITSGISGEVTFVGKKGDYGNQVIITDEQGNQHMYSHLNTANVKVGDKVNSGETIALSGNTGFSTGPHLDYRVKGADGKWQDPNMYSGLGEKETGPIDAGSGAPIAYARRIKSMVPATLMNSEVELQQLNDTIGELYKKGVSAEDAVLTYLGVEFDPDVKDLGINLIDKVRGLELDPSYYSSMTDLLNKGKIDQAVRKTENLAIKEAQKLNPDLKFSEGGTTFAVKQANNILDLVNEYESKFGTITGKWENLTKGFFGDKEAQELATKITQAISKTRNDLVGSNITAGEQGAIGELIPRLDESAETAKVKLNNLKNSPLLQYNQARASVGLPELDENSLLNMDERINLYRGITTETPKTPTTTISPDVKTDWDNFLNSKLNR